MKDLSTSKLRFLADEDVDARLIKSLSGKGVDIVYAPKGVRAFLNLLLSLAESFKLLLTKLWYAVFMPTKTKDEKFWLQLKELKNDSEFRKFLKSFIKESTS